MILRQVTEFVLNCLDIVAINKQRLKNHKCKLEMRINVVHGIAYEYIVVKTMSCISHCQYLAVIYCSHEIHPLRSVDLTIKRMHRMRRILNQRLSINFI